MSEEKKENSEPVKTKDSNKRVVESISIFKDPTNPGGWRFQIVFSRPISKSNSVGSIPFNLERIRDIIEDVENEL